MTRTLPGFTSTVVLTAALTAGCASVAPSPLVEARRAYDASSKSLAAQLSPTELLEARKVLDQANAEFEANGDTTATRDYAYVAMRRVQFADATARTSVDRARLQEAVRLGDVFRGQQTVKGRRELAEVQDERAAFFDVTGTGLAAKNAQQGNELERSTAALEAERAASSTGDAKLGGAMKELSTVAAVHQEPRGVVITLSGSVLFAPGTSTLLETARPQLAQVATALKAQSEDRVMSVEGHTDSMDTDAAKHLLSLDRAIAVRDSLVSSGVDSARISAVGIGSRRPVVSSTSAENRSNNRRVEIVVGPMPVSTR